MPTTMFFRRLGAFRRPKALATPPSLAPRQPCRFTPHPRHSSTTPPPPPPSSTRASKIISRLPARLQKYAAGLRSAPVSHVVAFLILHEITAVVPLVSLVALFQYTSYAPVDFVTGRWSGHVRDGAASFERYFRRKGWFGFAEDDGVYDDDNKGRSGVRTAVDDALGPVERESKTKKGESTFGAGGALKVSVSGEITRPVETEASTRETRNLIMDWEKGGDDKYRFLANVAVAWAITKAILPARILASAWATPWFARVMISTRNLFRRR